MALSAASLRSSASRQAFVNQRSTFRPSVARVSRLPTVRAMASAEEVFAAEDKIAFTLDASANGCTGMFWRSKPDMNASVSSPDWPRNGAKLQGWLSKQHAGWVKIDHPKNYWLPVEQYGKPIIHFNK